MLQILLVAVNARIFVYMDMTVFRVGFTKLDKACINKNIGSNQIQIGNFYKIKSPGLRVPFLQRVRFQRLPPGFLNFLL